MTGMRTGIAILIATLASPLAAQSIEPDGGGRIQSLEAQSILIDGERYDVTGAQVRLLDSGSRGDASGDDGPPGRLVGTVSEDRPIESLVPHGVKRAAYELRGGGGRHIRSIWFAAPRER